SGIVAQFSGQPEEARRHFEDCIRINRDHPRAHGCLAVLAAQQGWIEIAEAQLYEALRIDPNDSEAKSMLRQLKQQTRRAN
ncbi:MAG TPA: tetratricopeptide repeat protein, partial [Candidatus Acidoferrum sp.]|nr:tetratricopeptide repeat protein [Candidatus Acidoferrum sp.]